MFHGTLAYASWFWLLVLVSSYLEMKDETGNQPLNY
jgi:hypothetical protein